MKLRGLIILGMLMTLGLTSLGVKALPRATRITINHDLHQAPAKAEVFLGQKATLQINVTRLQPILRKSFLHYYFSPWQQPFLFAKVTDFRAMAQEALAVYQHDPGWLENKQRNTHAAIAQLAANMNLSAFPNLKVRAITVRETNLRALPTNKPIFGNWRQPGQGYPFDNLQISRLTANLPIYVLHTSRDGAWLLVSTSEEDFGWINSLDVAAANPEFIRQWMSHSQTLVIATKDGIPLFNQQQKFAAKSRIGELFPLTETTAQSYVVDLAARDINGDAQISKVRLNKSGAQAFPVALQAKNIARMIDSMLDIPYGWGELYGYRDCSATTKDLYAVFGVWLPRNSGQQITQGQMINLQGLSRAKKIALIKQQGKPFYTLLSLPGHIMLYLGEYQHTLWVFHSPWGLHTTLAHSHKTGRAIIGRSVITPLNFGNQYDNVKQSLLDRVDGMNTIVS